MYTPPTPRYLLTDPMLHVAIDEDYEFYESDFVEIQTILAVNKPPSACKHGKFLMRVR